MKYYGIDSIGEIKIEHVDSLPTWIDDYNRRIVLNYADGYMYFGYYKWIKLTNYSDVIDAINHVDLTNNPHNVTTDQINAVSVPDFNDHLTDYDDPHQTLGNYQAPGYVIYNTVVAQSSFDVWSPLSFEQTPDSYNLNNRIVINGSNDTFTLQRGYYRINFKVKIHEIDDSTPPLLVQMYNKTTDTYLEYTYVDTELDNSVQHTTISFGFPLFLSTETELQLRFRGYSSQKAESRRSTIAFEIPLALENY